MALPTLANWEATRDALHQIALVVGAVRVACIDPLPNDLQFSLDVTSTGLSTGRMRCGGFLDFDFAEGRLTFSRCESVVFTLDATGFSQQSLARRLLNLFGDCGYSIDPSMKHITHDSIFAIDPDIAADYMTTLDAIHTALARFRAKLGGWMSPLVLWPHHFDMAFIYFPTSGIDEHSDPQIAFGFAPFSPGLERPYIYAYAWSEPTGYAQVPLDAPAVAITEGYTGLYAAYDDLREQHDFNATIARMLLTFRELTIQQFA